MSRKRHFIVLASAIATVAWAAACGDGSTEPPAPPPDPPRPTTVTVTPATGALTALGATVQFRAEVRDQNGQPMASASVTWASNAPVVATVNASGLVTAVGNGTATITATAGSVSGTAAVTVAQTLNAIVVTPAADTVVAGDTLRLTAEARDANGSAVAGAEFAWASGDTAVAVVDTTGLVTGVGAGEVEITATSSGVTGRATLTVAAPAPTTVAVTPDTLEFTALGDTLRLMAEVLDQLGRPIEGESAVWESEDTLVAAVDSAGLVTAAGNGAATITAAAGAASGTAVVTVTQSVRSVTVSPSADTIAPGDTLRLEAEALDENGHRVAGARFTWSSSNTSVATVESGLVRGVGEGMAILTATAGDAHGTADVTVMNPDRATLIALYEATDGPNWVNSENWLTDEPLGDWYGVRTDASGRVVGLDLSGRWDSDEERLVRQGLVGSIPPELGSLANLTALWLSNNNLAGPIPPELGNLTQLKSLALDGNDFSGPVPPELGRLANLESLVLELNNLTGPIPPELGRLANLTSLSLWANELAGPIPPELGRLTNLRALWLWSNRLAGPVPHELGRLANLEGLDVSGNNLGGPIPQNLLELTKLETLKFADNDSLCAPGTSAFATWLDGIENRDETTLYCNASDAAVLDGLYETAGGSDWTHSTGWRASPVLEEWYGVDADFLGRVTGLDLSHNGLSGKIPISLSRLTRLTALKINGNDLSGRLPLALTALSLRELHYADTELCTPTNGSFREWLKSIASHEGTGEECGFAFTSLEVSETDPLTSIGETVELSVTGVSDDGAQPVDNALIDWQSSDPAVATVSEGVVTAVRGGNATITASYEEHTAESVVSVWISTLRERSVRVLYVMPADREFRADYSAGITKAIVDVQSWYRRQLDGLTFDIYSVVPEQCRLPGNEDYYSHGDVWAKVLEDVQPCAPVQHGSSRFKWALYVDAEERCPEADEPHELGRGGNGVTMLPWNDLELMVRPGVEYCGQPTGRDFWGVVGGLAHELAHTFHVPHPPGCDEGLATCDVEALMAYGYNEYPDTYFRDDDKVILRRSPFIKR